ncbi:hypothetical protein EIN_093280, partial [Entamoeba invadens IP1]
MYFVKTFITFLLLFLSRSTNYWCEHSNTLTLQTNSSECYQTNWSYSYNKNDVTFIFKNGCCSSQKISIEHKVGDNMNVHFRFEKDNYLKALFIREQSTLVRIFIWDNDRPDMLFVSYGCFNGEGYCRTNINDKFRPCAEIFSKGISIYSDVDQKHWIYYHRSKTNIAYLFIDGKVTQSVMFQDRGGGVVGNIYEKTRFLFLGKSHDTTVKVTYFVNATARSVCARKGYERFLLFKNDEIESLDVFNTKCNCDATNTNITKESVNTYPDCQYNSSLFDLDLTKIQTDTPLTSSINIKFEISKWFSLLFKMNNVYILESIKNKTDILEIEILEMKEGEDITFRLNCVVNNLKISSLGKYYFQSDLQINNVEITM